MHKIESLIKYYLELKTDFVKILLVEDDELSRNSLQLFLEENMNYEVLAVPDGESALESIKESFYPVVITDIRMPGINGIELLKEIKIVSSSTEVIIMTGVGDMQSSIDALKFKAYDYLLKPVNIEELAVSLKKIEQLQKLVVENSSLKGHLKGAGEKVKEGEAKLYGLDSTLDTLKETNGFGFFSPVMNHVVDLCMCYHKERDVPVIITGETGTGKEVVAKILHNGRVGKNDKPFIPVNCAAIPSHLFESELFGYVDGAFTGARKNGAPGKLELAQGGTVFLDEIGELPIEFQPKLLRAIQEREIYRVGGDKLIKLDIRIICATNCNLEDMVRDNKFRSDLYYRLNIGQIHIPPLRKRKDDIIPLAKMFLNKYSRKRKKEFKDISPEASRILADYIWPGNIRELQACIERIVLLNNEELVEKKHVIYLLANQDENVVVAEGYTLELGKIILPERQLYVEELEMEIVSKALIKFDNNKTKVAEYLGISRSALRSRLRKL